VPGRIVVFNVFGHRNTGDAMLLESLVDILKAHRPISEIEGIAFDVSSEREWMPEIRWHERVGNKVRPDLIGKIRQAIALVVTMAIATSRLFLPLKALLIAEQRRAVEALDGADLALSCSGGYLEDSNTAYLLNLLQMLLAHRLSRRVVLAPQSIGPIRSRFGRAALRWTLTCMDALYVREESSMAFLRAEFPDLDVPVHASGDLAFWYDRQSKVGEAEEWAKLGVNPAKPIVGITVVEWYFPHHLDPAAAQARYLRALSALIRKLQEEDKYQIIVFNQVSSDLPIARTLALMNPGVIVDSSDRDSGVFAAMISRCQIFVGSRFHSCIFALLGSVPTIAIAYLPKTTGIMSDLGLSDFVLPIDEIKPEDLIAKFDAMCALGGAMSENLRGSIARYRALNGRFNADLIAWIEGTTSASGPARSEILESHHAA